MIATFVMNGNWIELPIDLWIEKQKMEDRIIEKECFNDWYGAMYDSLCITAWDWNAGSILISDYTENNQSNDWTRVDYIELTPSWRIELPRNRSISAFNRPMVMWQSGDILKVVAR